MTKISSKNKVLSAFIDYAFSYTCNNFRFTLYKTSKQRYKEEGLNTLRYKVIAKEFHLLYTLIKVYYNETDIMNVSMS